MTIDNLAQANAEIEKLWRRLERLERGAPIGFSSVSRGALRIISPEGLIVEGTARISGTLDGDGNLNWSGAITFTGPFSIDGVTTQNGDYTVNGAWHLIGDGDIAGDVNMTGLFDLTGDATLAGAVDITGVLKVTGPSEFVGTLNIKGASTLEGNLNVKSNGKITIEGIRAMVIGLLSNGYPGIEFPAARITSTASGLLLSTSAGGGQLGLSPTLANLSVGSTSVSMNGEAVSVLGDLKAYADVYLLGLPTIEGVSANMTVDPTTGQVGTV